MNYFLGYFTSGFLFGNLLLRAAPKPVVKSYVVSLVGNEPAESETLAVFTDAESAVNYSQEIAREYNRHDWFVSIKEVILNDSSVKPILKDVPDVDIYPCPIEWDN
jgi:hypothetical protein